jgi:alanine dehydrogenase
MRYINNDELRRIVSIDESRQVINDLFQYESVGQAENKPTVELTIPNGFFRIKAGVAYGSKAFGFKAYGGIGRASRYLVHVYSLETGIQMGIVEARALTEIRTGGVSAVATQYMARPESETLGMIGTGREARAQAAAVCKVRPIKTIRAWSRSAENREAFARDVREQLGVDAQVPKTAEEAVRDADIVLTITSARDPIVQGSWLSDGMFLCAVGATTPERREFHSDAIDRAGTIVVEHLPQAQGECGELLDAVSRGTVSWSKVHELKDIVSGKISGRALPSEINLFDSIGVGTEDIAIATFALNKAMAEGGGREIDL